MLRKRPLVGKALLLALVIVLALLIYLDPYMKGRSGGDLQFVAYPWQRLAGHSLLTLLATGWALVAASRAAWAYYVLATEAVLFVTLNCYLIARDGLARLSSGYVTGHDLVLILVAGALLRWMALLQLKSLVRRSRLAS